jgi:hypothetical protein
MKKLLFTMLTLLTVTASAQKNTIYIDVTYSRMKERVAEDNCFIEKESNHDGERVVHIRNNEYGDDLLSLTFYTGEVCTSQGILMYNMNVINEQVKLYNQNFVTLSKDSWRVYVKGKSYICNLKTLKDNTFYFHWLPEN